jgi:hypothetical protein
MTAREERRESYESGKAAGRGEVARMLYDRYGTSDLARLLDRLDEAETIVNGLASRFEGAMSVTRRFNDRWRLDRFQDGVLVWTNPYGPDEASPVTESERAWLDYIEHTPGDGS